VTGGSFFWKTLSIPAALRRARVTDGEVLAAARSAGVADIALVSAVVLETDGSFSVIQGKAESENSSLVDVRGDSSNKVG